ncbi:MAG TPA: hypothetical protein ENI69_00440 [Rhodospirillales bacterium]|nr:hypothetical protein [Rhodospirillales bacterium]
MKRRDFFRLGVGKTAEIVHQVDSEQAAQRAAKWFRPPFAVAEVDFRLDCTRCDKCIAACPHQVLFALPGRYGADVSKRPSEIHRHPEAG